MAEVKPFRGLRVESSRAARVAAPPYDVLGEDEARAIALENPDTFLRVTKPEIQTAPGAGSPDGALYALAASAFGNMREQGLFVAETNPVFYVYRLTLDGRSQSGLVACVSVEDYESGVIRKHELTRRDKEDERARHIEAVGAHTGPVLMAYRAQSAVRAILRGIEATDPVCDFESADGVRHTLWTVSEPDALKALEVGFQDVSRLYIADGHHRAAAAARVRDTLRAKNPSHTGREEYNRFLAVLFPDDELRVMGYHRVVKDLNGLTATEFMSRLVEAGFEAEPTSGGAPDLGAGRFGMFLDGAWHRVRIPVAADASADAVERLDASVLQDRVLAPILGIRDIRTDPRVDFVGGMRGMKELERRCGLDARVAFALAPVALARIMAVADENRIMPPKSTWFEPKLRSGLVVHAITAL